MGHRSGIVIAGFSPDDHWIVTASDDTTARLWPYFADIGKLTRIVRPTLGRCLTQSQREAYGLPVTDTTVDHDRVVAPDTAGKCPQIGAPAAHSVDGSGLLLPVGG
jgi:hypothetical protein